MLTLFKSTIPATFFQASTDMRMYEKVVGKL